MWNLRLSQVLQQTMRGQGRGTGIQESSRDYVSLAFAQEGLAHEADYEHCAFQWKQFSCKATNKKLLNDSSSADEISSEKVSLWFYEIACYCVFYHLPWFKELKRQFDWIFSEWNNTGNSTWCPKLSTWEQQDPMINLFTLPYASLRSKERGKRNYLL